MLSAIKQEKIIGSIRRLENVVATKPFQDALQNLIDDPEELAKAVMDPKPYFNSFGVVLPKGFDIELKHEKPAKTAGKAVKMAATIIICVSWCTKDACYTYCIRINLAMRDF